MNQPPLRVLVVDDSVTYRKIVSEALRGLPDVEVVGTAINGTIALEKIWELRPDCITLDLEMPDMSGLDVLRRLQAEGRSVGVIMLAAFTGEAAAATTVALGLGAFDFVLKPSGPNSSENFNQLRTRLSDKLQAFVRSRVLRSAALRIAPAAEGVFRLPPRKPCELIVLGVSTGGPEALGRVLPALPNDLAAPLLIVQHMPALFTRSLADDLDKRCRVRVSEAHDGQHALPGQVLIAPGGRQMKVAQEAGRFTVRITDDPPENSCRPSVDCLFRSASQVCGDSTLAVIMTGMGCDGATGCRLLKRRGATIIAQDRASCVVFGMPMYPIEEGLADIVSPLDDLADHIVACAGRAQPCV
jgi:two-component system chemotaxis response regulator CheB